VKKKKKKKKTKEKLYKTNLKLLNYKNLLTEKNLNIENNQINFVKNQKKIYVSYLCVIFPKLKFSTLF
jgi:hypothetical protein